nr:MAG TPA: hypothetical protein [Caudoviricetes sp.]
MQHQMSIMVLSLKANLRHIHIRSWKSRISKLSMKLNDTNCFQLLLLVIRNIEQ